MTLLPNGLCDLYAIAGNASCTRGPIGTGDPQARWWVELPELGRRHAPGGEVWPPNRLNCGLQTSS